MSVSTVAAEGVVAPDRPRTESAAGWNPVTRLAFRFVFSYFMLYCLFYPQILFFFLGPLVPEVPENLKNHYRTYASPMVEWVGRTVFDTDAALNLRSGSADQKYAFVLSFCFLVLAAVATVVWSALDRRRLEYRKLTGWFLLFIRWCLASQMMFYGFVKLIPNQMAEPSLATLLRPFGDFTTVAVLWNQVGISPVYEVLLGAAEVMGALMLLPRRTRLAGILLSLVCLAQVLVLNLAYDVPVKLIAFHLLLMGLVLLAPEARRLATVLSGAAAGPSTSPEAFRPTRIRTLVQVVLAIWLVAGFLTFNMNIWRDHGPNSPKSELYGIWNIDEFVRDGQLIPPLITDETRWRRLVFDDPKVLHIQRMDSSLTPVPATIDPAAHTLRTRKAPAAASLKNTHTVQGDPSAIPQLDFTFDRPAPDRLVLTGTVSGKPVTLTLSRQDENDFRLKRDSFQLVQENWDSGE